MTSIASQKAYLYETSGSAKSRDRYNLDYKLEGHHATLACRDSGSIKGKYSLSVGRKIEVSKEKEPIEPVKRQNVNYNYVPVILPECGEDMGGVTREVSEDSGFKLMRENTDDVPLTSELLSNQITRTHMSRICSACANGVRNENTNKLIQDEYSERKPCQLCQKQTPFSNRPAIKQDKTLLMSIVYPHDFYDRYQSARKTFNTNSEDCEKRRERRRKIMHQKVVLPKPNFSLPETVNEGDKVILKPHVVKFKEKDKHEIEMVSNIQKAEPETDFPSLKSPLFINQPKHLRCQPQMKAYFVASMSSKNFVKDRFSFFGQRNSFKGCMVSKSDKYEKTKPVDMKHSFFNVGTLGLTIGIPEYNDKLGTRQTCTNNYLSRTFTSLTDVSRPRSMLPPLKNKVRPPGSLGHRSMP